MFYKIMDKDTGLFSTGGMDPKWTTKGKTWNSIGHVKSHFKLFKSYSYKLNPYFGKNIEVLCYDMCLKDTIHLTTDIKTELYTDRWGNPQVKYTFDPFQEKL